MPGSQPQSKTDTVSPEHEYEPKISCKHQEHNFQYFPSSDGHKAFCTKCGKVINLDGNSSVRV